MGTNPAHPPTIEPAGSGWDPNGPGLAEKLERRGQGSSCGKTPRGNEGLHHARPALHTLAWHRHLAVCIDHGAQQLPGATPPVHSDHAQDLQEAQAPERRCGEHIALGTSSQHSDGRDEHHDVCRRWRSWGVGPLLQKGGSHQGSGRMDRWTHTKGQQGLVPQPTQPNPSLGMAAQHLTALHSGCINHGL